MLLGSLTCWGHQECSPLRLDLLEVARSLHFNPCHLSPRTNINVTWMHWFLNHRNCLPAWQAVPSFSFVSYECLCASNPECKTNPWGGWLRKRLTGELCCLSSWEAIGCTVSSKRTCPTTNHFSWTSALRLQATLFQLAGSSPKGSSLRNNKAQVNRSWTRAQMQRKEWQGQVQQRRLW